MPCTLCKNGTHETLYCIHYLRYAPLHLLSITIILPDEDSRSLMWHQSWKEGEGERVTVKPYVAPVLRGKNNSTSLLFLNSLSFLEPYAKKKNIFGHPTTRYSVLEPTCTLHRTPPSYNSHTHTFETLIAADKLLCWTKFKKLFLKNFRKFLKILLSKLNSGTAIWSTAWLGKLA